MNRPFVIGVGGFTSNVGKTTLMCDLIQAFPGWEAIKVTKGHYRSCGKEAEACCVSHLLSDEPLIKSGRAATYALGKDTGRYWDAGASNVHWVIATKDQVEKGIKEALSRVCAEGVFVEGNSFSQFVETDYFVMVKLAQKDTIKTSAKAVLPKVSAIYIPDLNETDPSHGSPPVFSSPNYSSLVSNLRLSLFAR